MCALDLDLVPPLCAAAGDGSLRLHFQPEVDLGSGVVVGMEALLRWDCPGRGLLRPADFLHVAEAAGLVRTLGRWVLATGIAEAQVWAQVAQPATQVPRLWLNVSAAQLSAPGFLAELERLLYERNLLPGALGLEFSEQTLALAHFGVPRLLTRLRALGVALCVDDFGTWHASMATLDRLSLDAVKLDRRFTAAMLYDLEGESVLASLAALAHRRGLSVVAEGVETGEEEARLGELGCDHAFGYRFCHPVPVDQARRMAASGDAPFGDPSERPSGSRSRLAAAER